MTRSLLRVEHIWPAPLAEERAFFCGGRYTVTDVKTMHWLVR